MKGAEWMDAFTEYQFTDDVYRKLGDIETLIEDIKIHNKGAMESDDDFSDGLRSLLNITQGMQKRVLTESSKLYSSLIPRDDD